jgi:hypothetical protein
VDLLRPAPPLNAGQAGVVQFRVLDNPPPRSCKVDVSAEPVINVPGTLRRPHRLIADLSAAIKGLREDKGVLPLNYRKFVRVRASAVHIQRGLNLMDTLLKEFASRSYEVRIDEKNAETLLVLNRSASGWTSVLSELRRRPCAWNARVGFPSLCQVEKGEPWATRAGHRASVIPWQDTVENRTRDAAGARECRDEAEWLPIVPNAQVGAISTRRNHQRRTKHDTRSNRETPANNACVCHRRHPRQRSKVADA